MTRQLIFCPVCENMVPHDRGYLTEHVVDRQRGILVTGTRLCDGSNTKPLMDLKTVHFSGMCTNCVTTVRREFKETFPGSLAQYGGVLVVNCPECGDEGDYCKSCGHNLHEVEADAPVEMLDDPQNEEETTLWLALHAAEFDLPGAFAIRDQYAPSVADDRVEALLQRPMVGGGGKVKVWVNGLNETFCDNGDPRHEAVHRERQEHPVTLTDSYVIPEPKDAT